MRREAFCAMLDYYAAMHNYPYDWRQKAYKQLYGSNEDMPTSVEPRSPTVVFLLMMRTLEARKLETKAQRRQRSAQVTASRPRPPSNQSNQ